MQKKLYKIREYLLDEWNRYLDSECESPEFVKHEEECGDALTEINNIIDIFGY